jgi:hypothetical protein
VSEGVEVAAAPCTAGARRIIAAAGVITFIIFMESSFPFVA